MSRRGSLPKVRKSRYLRDSGFLLLTDRKNGGGGFDGIGQSGEIHILGTVRFLTNRAHGGIMWGNGGVRFAVYAAERELPITDLYIKNHIRRTNNYGRFQVFNARVQASRS